MSDDPLQKAKSDTLQQRPQRRSGRRLSSWLVPVIIGTVVIAVGVLLAISLTPHASSTVRVVSTPTATVDTKGQADLCRPSLPWDTILQETATGLHLSVNQVEIQTRAGKGILDIAQAQGVTLEQLHTLELHALHVGGDRWVQLHCSTQQEINDRLQSYIGMTPEQLNGVFTDTFKGSSS